MNRQDWLLLALDAAGELGLDPVRLQKVLFVFGAEMSKAEETKGVVSDWYSFRAYDYGPFSQEIYKDVEVLAMQDLAEERPDAVSRVRFIATAGTRAKAEGLKQQADPKDFGYIAKLVKWANQQTFSGLLSTVYAKYPDMAKNSVFRRPSSH